MLVTITTGEHRLILHTSIIMLKFFHVIGVNSSRWALSWSIPSVSNLSCFLSCLVLQMSSYTVSSLSVLKSNVLRSAIPGKHCFSSSWPWTMPSLTASVFLWQNAWEVDWGKMKRFHSTTLDSKLNLPICFMLYFLLFIHFEEYLLEFLSWKYSMILKFAHFKTQNK